MSGSVQQTLAGHTDPPKGMRIQTGGKGDEATETAEWHRHTRNVKGRYQSHHMSLEEAAPNPSPQDTGQHQTRHRQPLPQATGQPSRHRQPLPQATGQIVIWSCREKKKHVSLSVKICEGETHRGGGGGDELFVMGGEEHHRGCKAAW